MSVERGGAVRRLAAAGAGAWTLLVLVLTLWPVSPAPHVQIEFFCVFCGSRGLADAILNVGLFVPLGLTVGLLRGWRAAALAAALLSGGVELAQLGLPGRYSTLGDVVFNTAGGALGGVLIPAARALPGFLAGPSRSGRTAVQAVSALMLLVPVLLMVPRFPATVYYGQWTPWLGGMERYAGRVRAAYVGAVPVPGGRLEEAGAVRRALGEGEDVRIELVAGPAPRNLAPLFAVYDGEERQIVFVGVEGEAVVYYRRSLGDALTLDHPGVHWPGAFTVAPGDTASLRIVRGRHGVCLVLDGRETCGAGLGARDGWRLLMAPGPSGLPPLAASLLGILWVAVVTAPAGAVAGRGRAALGVGLLLGASGMALSWVGPELAAHPETLLGAVAGAFGGHGSAGVLVRAVRRRAGGAS